MTEEATVRFSSDEVRDVAARQQGKPVGAEARRAANISAMHHMAGDNRQMADDDGIGQLPIEDAFGAVGNRTADEHGRDPGGHRLCPADPLENQPAGPWGLGSEPS